MIFHYRNEAKELIKDPVSARSGLVMGRSPAPAGRYERPLEWIDDLRSQPQNVCVVSDDNLK